jgi:predicted RNA-binding protein with PUA-like domain
MPQYWLMKTEPDTFSIDDLERVKIEPWTGVRSMFARFHMRNMQPGDEVLFYHSSCEPPGVAGIARITRTKLVDETQFDPASKYFDPKATREKPIWDCAEVELVRRLPRFVSLGEIRIDPHLATMPLLQRGMRLSVQPVTEDQFQRIVAKADEPAPDPAVLEALVRVVNTAVAKLRAGKKKQSLKAAKRAAKATPKTKPKSKTKPKTKPSTKKKR